MWFGSPEHHAWLREEAAQRREAYRRECGRDPEW
jgi:hypothetical protein